jgi:hypothetical protein
MIGNIHRRGSTVGTLLVAAGAAALLGGCTTLQNQSRVDPRTVAFYARGDQTGTAACPGRIPGDTHGGAINLDCFKFPKDTSPLTAYQQATATGAPGQAARNRLASILMKHADDVCTMELGRLTANEAISNTLLASLSSALSGVATIVNGETAKEIFAGGAGFATATRSHINANVYRNVLSTAVSNAIHIERDKKRGAINAELTKDSTAYNVDQMIVDVNAYHQICSFYRGLTFVLKAVERSKFEESDRAGSLRAAIELLDVRIAQLDAQKTAAGSDTARKEALQKQIDPLVEQRSGLVKELATVRAAAAGGAEPPKS